MDDTSDCLVSYNCGVSTCLVDKDIHSVRVFKIAEMEKILFFFQQVNRIKPISLSPSSIINLLGSISVENSPFAWSFSEVKLKSLSKSIDEIGVDLGTDFNVVLAENDAVIVGRKQCGIVGLPEYSKIKRISRVLKLNSGHIQCKGRVGQRIIRERISQRNFIPGLVDVCDLEVKVVESVYLEYKN